MQHSRRDETKELKLEPGTPFRALGQRAVDSDPAESSRLRERVRALATENSQLKLEAATHSALASPPKLRAREACSEAFSEAGGGDIESGESGMPDDGNAKAGRCATSSLRVLLADLKGPRLVAAYAFAGYLSLIHLYLLFLYLFGLCPT
mmetsp:Transcript_51297/g.116623  ORF Transcript_51297/g.116623 Transcript_51297/m.116623 type:complete len:150 (-) Transcript_51297:12-461(-)